MLGIALTIVALSLGVLAPLGSALLHRGRLQRAADLAALSGARRMHDDFERLFEPALDEAGRPNALHLDRRRYLERARAAVLTAARLNGADAASARVEFPDGASFAPTRVMVRLGGALPVTLGSSARRVRARASAEAELTPTVSPALATDTSGGYAGPFAYRQGKPMRPDVALAFDRMATAARRDRVALLITSAYRSDSEQAELFRRHPDPRWVAPPGHSLHRNATELDLGPPPAYGWLAANAPRFGFRRRYAWEPWHFGYVLNPRSTPSALRGAGRPGDGRGAVPAFVPAPYVASIARAAMRWNVSGALLAAQLYAESNFNPFATSRAGARGIAQFMPGTARAYGLANPLDPHASIDAQAHLMRDLLRRFGSVALALAAYNAGPGAVEHCGCVPPYPETQAYVTRILALMSGAGEVVMPASGPVVRLVS